MLFSKDVLLSTNVLLFSKNAVNYRSKRSKSLSKHRWSHNIANPPRKVAAGRRRSFCSVRKRHHFSVAVCDKNISLFMKLLFLLLF